MKDAVIFSGKSEVSPLKFELNFKDIDEFSDSSILSHPPEKEYYENILTAVLENIDNEIQGRNPYKLVQSPKTTRRFVFTQDSCISFVHTMVRNSTINMFVVCRSSDVVNTFPYDIKFLIYLCSCVKKRLRMDLPCRINFTLNSAHVVPV